jgi:hypothetical protein
MALEEGHVLVPHWIPDDDGPNRDVIQHSSGLSHRMPVLSGDVRHVPDNSEPVGGVA